MATKKSVILAIETSCDETAAAVLEVHKKGSNIFPYINTVSSVVKSQIQLHKKMGGVVPEAAARAHVKNIFPVVKKALADASQLSNVKCQMSNVSCQLSNVKCQLSNVDYIAVTQGPGLIPSLIVGVEFAKALSLATGIPLLPINHMAGHLYSPLPQIKDKRFPPKSDPLPAEKTKDVFPHIALIVSGGHTMLVLMKNLYDYRILGQTVDDAAGEAFDKVAKLLNLPYPGGPEVSKMAKRATEPVNFPRPMMHSKNYNFSFAGLKTAVLYYVRNNGQMSRVNGQMFISNVCAGFQNAAVDVLVAKTMRAAKEFKAKSVSLSGGVSANAALRENLKVESKKNKLRLFVPPMNLCTDNAEMIGIAAAVLLQKNLKPAKNPAVIQADSSLNL